MIELFKRNCVSCSPVSCNCPEGQRCMLTVKTCDKCPEARCLGVESNNKSSGKLAGVIAGSIVGGLVAIGILIGVLLWLKFRHRRLNRLQVLDEAALDLSGSDSPMLDPQSPEAKPPSITSTYGGASRRSNVIPIMFPFNQAASQGPNTGAPPLRKTRSFSGKPVLEQVEENSVSQSHRDSKYSMGSDTQSVLGNQQLTSYDVAVSGTPNLIEVNSAARKQAPRQLTLQRISESESLDSSSERSSNRRSLRTHRSSKRDSNARLPDLPSDRQSEASNRHKSISPFDDSASEDYAASASQRLSKTSSTAYSAHLPDEVRVYQGFGLLS